MDQRWYSVEEICEHLGIAGHVNETTPASRKALLHEKIEPMLERELQHREIVPDGGSYAAKLIGWVEVSEGSA